MVGGMFTNNEKQKMNFTTRDARRRAATSAYWRQSYRITNTIFLFAVILGSSTRIIGGFQQQAPHYSKNSRNGGAPFCREETRVEESATQGHFGIIMETKRGISPLHSTTDSTSATSETSNVSSNTKKLREEVDALKRVLEREYISFFNPMKKEYYAPSVTFDDPLTSLDGVDAYQNNVDMLGSRSLFGKIAFKDGNIILHNISGGEVSDDGQRISDIITRWTLKFTFKLLPWSPTAVFSGISVYGVKPTSQVSSSSSQRPGVQIVSQADYWDSIDMVPGGDYKRADKSKALGDFLDQLNPNKVLGLSPSAMSSELPYTLLRRGNGYEVRRYPAFASVKIQYQRRDEGYDVLGSFTNAMNPLSPAIMKVPSDGSNKTMMWPIAFKSPVETSLKVPDFIMEKVSKQTMVEIEPSKEQVIAVGIFADASTEPVVRDNAKRLRQALKRDGMIPTEDDGSVTFAQYDAVYTMGKRRGEVWIELTEDGHPWN